MKLIKLRGRRKDKKSYKVSNEAVKTNAFALKEELRFIEFVNFPDGHILRSNGKIREAFRVCFRNLFHYMPDLRVQEFHSY